MISIAIIDNNPEDCRQLEKKIDKFFTDKDLTYSVDSYTEPKGFLDSFSSQYDIITLDIGMPSMDGMTLARRIRKYDSDVIIIFITELASYAINGYEVEALDFMVKPINYYDFALKMKRAVSRLQTTMKAGRIIVKTPQGVVQLRQRDILYVEIFGHWATYHTVDGEYQYYGTLKDVEKLLEPSQFCRCNSCYLVNLSYVEKVDQVNCVVGGHELRVSQTRRKEFINRLGQYFSMGGHKQ